MIVNSTKSRKKEVKSLKGLICDLLSWSEMEYAEFQYSAGVEYLLHYIPDDPAGADQLVRSRIYWAWWRNHWAGRDRSFSSNWLCDLSIPTRREIYAALHDPRTLAGSLYLGRVVLDESYAEMIGRMFDTEVSAK